MLTLSLLLIILLSIVLYFSIKKNFELFDKVQQIEDTVQVCMGVIDGQIEKMEEKTKIEVFSDEPIIRELIKDMVTAKESVVAVSKLLDELIEEQEQKEDE